MIPRDLAARIAPQPPFPASPPPRGTPALDGPAFAALLAEARGPARPNLTLSAHASERAEARGIDLSTPVQARIAGALDALADKGAHDALLLGPDAAFVVNVPNRTVVTALDPSEMKDRVFTQIDSAALL